MSSRQFRKGVFISYSHADRKWLERLRTHLAPYISGEKVELWEDTMIAPGADWHEEISKVIQHARVAVLLVSPSYLASDYVTRFELPAIAEQAGQRLIVVWVLLFASAWEETRLRNLQAAWDPSRPLATLSKARQEAALADIAKRIAASMDINAIANALAIIDEFEPEARAFIAGQPEPTVPVKHSLYAEQVSDQINLVEPSASRKLISAADLERLDPNAQKLIRAYERTMKELFERWTELKPKRVSRDDVIRRETREESDAVRMDLCGELNDLLNFIESMGMSLHDHYVHVRYICSQRPR